MTRPSHRLVCVKLLDDFPVVLFHDDERDDLRTLVRLEILVLDALSVKINLFLVSALELSEQIGPGTARLLGKEGLGNFLCPVDLCPSEEDLAL